MDFVLFLEAILCRLPAVKSLSERSLARIIYYFIDGSLDTGPGGMNQDHGTHRLISAGMWQFDLRHANFGVRVQFGSNTDEFVFLSRACSGSAKIPYRV